MRMPSERAPDALDVRQPLSPRLRSLADRRTGHAVDPLLGLATPVAACRSVAARFLKLQLSIRARVLLLTIEPSHLETEILGKAALPTS